MTAAGPGSECRGGRSASAGGENRAGNWRMPFGRQAQACHLTSARSEERIMKC